MWKTTPEGIVIAVKVTPKANKNEISGWENGELKIRITAIPEKGNANEQLISFLSSLLKISQSRIKLINGSTSRHKRLCFLDMKPEDIQFLL
ncbi:MAG TPA: DUF167 domain-containing protein [Parachlamydiaceae bacterium]|nr:DUF167 domain-containing protein [Parachlamydiaceae bacterium]